MSASRKASVCLVCAQARPVCRLHFPFGFRRSANSTLRIRETGLRSAFTSRAALSPRSAECVSLYSRAYSLAEPDSTVQPGQAFDVRAKGRGLGALLAAALSAARSLRSSCRERGFGSA